jgi:hypothetical protein
VPQDPYGELGVADFRHALDRIHRQPGVQPVVDLVEGGMTHRLKVLQE